MTTIRYPNQGYHGAALCLMTMNQPILALKSIMFLFSVVKVIMLKNEEMEEYFHFFDDKATAPSQAHLIMSEIHTTLHSNKEAVQDLTYYIDTVQGNPYLTAEGCIL